MGAAKKLTEAVEAVGPDARLATNKKPHLEALLTEAQRGGLTKAKATKLRLATMKACQCRLCALAVKPPVTFEEVKLFGLDTIRAEHDEAVAA